MKGLRTIGLAAVISICSTMTVTAADISTIKVTGCPEKLMTEWTNSKMIESIPQEVFDSFNTDKSKVEVEPRVYGSDGVEVAGLYYFKGELRDRIKISAAYDQLGYDLNGDILLTHEIGHYIYFNTSLTKENKDVIESMYNRFKDYDSHCSSVEEAFASRYVTYKSGAYSLLPEEIEMFKSVEETFISQYNRELDANGYGPAFDERLLSKTNANQ